MHFLETWIEKVLTNTKIRRMIGATLEIVSKELNLTVCPVPNLGKTMRSPQSDLTPWILTLGYIL